VVEIAIPAGFDFSWALGFLAARTVPALERVSDGTYTRVVRAEGRPVTIVLREARAAPNAARRVLVASARPGMAPTALTAAVTRMLDLDADLATFHRLARRDPILTAIVRARAGIRLPQLLDPFEGVIRGILGQQVSVAGASTVTDRLVRLLAPPARDRTGRAGAAGGFLVFPTAEVVAGAGADRLRTIGLTRAKAAAIAGVSRAIADGALDLEAVRAMPADDAQAALESLPGIGPWTASYVRMRALGDRDAFPAADLGVIKALAAAGVDRRAIVGVAERWRPWRAYATLHLWASLKTA
jgi:3-methyladenine DNA glycosylase/8-oxoguanine DNA glycosylase